MQINQIRQLYFLALFSLSLSQLTKAQSEQLVFDYGDIPRSHIEMTEYDNDPTANAVVLFDKGNAEIRYHSTIGFRLYYQRHKRVKILEDAGVYKADVVISYRHYAPKQRIKNVKATSFTLSEDGRIIEQSISKDDLYIERKNKSWSDLKFSTPGVKKGSVIDISYEMEMDFSFWYPNWYFQDDVPTIWSEYTTRIPEYFSFAYQILGVHDLFNKVDKEYNARMGSDFQKGSDLLFSMKDIPAFPDEPYIRARKEYEDRVEFQFISLNIPGRERIYYSKPWHEIIKSMLSDREFGKKIKSSREIKKKVDELVYREDTDIENLKNIYHYVSQNIKWNDEFGLFLEKSTTNVFDEKIGSASEINMLLLQMLKDANYDALPLIVSTHDHGKINKEIGVVDQFNHALVYVNIGDDAIILDATNKNRPYNLLPESVIGVEGLLLVRDRMSWVSVSSIAQNVNLKNMMLFLSENGFNSSLKVQESGTFALKLRSNLNNEDSVLSMQKHLFGENTLVEVQKISEYTDDFELSASYKVEFDLVESVTGEVIYFNPMVLDRVSKNPFTLDKRLFPVDFIYTSNQMINMSIVLPEGWEVDEIPQPMIYRLPGNTAEFQRIIKASEGIVLYRYGLKINKPRFSPEEYEELKKFYDAIVAAHSETIVLRKAS